MNQIGHAFDDVPMPMEGKFFEKVEVISDEGLAIEDNRQKVDWKRIGRSKTHEGDHSCLFSPFARAGRRHRGHRRQWLVPASPIQRRQPQHPAPPYERITRRLSAPHYPPQAQREQAGANPDLRPKQGQFSRQFSPASRFKPANARPLTPSTLELLNP
ncbi:MAG: hypothetical protein ABR964_02100 [Tepidisphaeraceae bacterium]